MKFKFIANACGVVEQNGFRVLCDPWLVDGVFEGSWCHCPPLSTTPQSVADVDALYISHLHPDHCDEKTLAVFRRDIPIIILDHGPNFLRKVLTSLGFTNLTPVKDKQSAKLGPLEISLFAPFARHNFHESEIGNLIDSAALFSDGKVKLFNANDNTPSVEAAAWLRELGITAALLNFNAAGPYPSCFDNLSLDEKRSEHKRILERNLVHMQQVATALAPKTVIPFAGAYVIGGRLWEKNSYLGTTSMDVARGFLEEQFLITGTKIESVSMRENDVYDLENLELLPHSAARFDCDSYIKNKLSKIIYPYETDPAPGDLAPLLEQSAAKLFEAVKRFSYAEDIIIGVAHGNENIFCLDFKTGTASQTTLAGFNKLDRPRLLATMDARLLSRILKREAHWNNAEIGCHISFNRVPNVYKPDVHTLMSFFHI